MRESLAQLYEALGTRDLVEIAILAVAIYTVLRVLSPVRGQILDYRQGEDPAGGLVGFAAVALNGVTLGDE